MDFPSWDLEGRAGRGLRGGEMGCGGWRWGAGGKTRLTLHSQTRGAPGCGPSSKGGTIFYLPKAIAVGGTVTVITRREFTAGRIKNLESRVKWCALWAGPFPPCRYLEVLICKMGLIPSTPGPLW